jgi:polyphosphate kinase 2
MGKDDTRRGQSGDPEEVLATVVASEDGDAVLDTTRASKATPLTHEELSRVTSRDGLIELLRKRKINLKKVVSVLRYEEELALLQVELVKLQRWVQEKKIRLAILFEGRDAAGKGGTIRRFTEHLNPRSMRVVALPKPTDEEAGQWYFQRYTRQLPNPGEIVFFDRSWYNRAVVEPVNGFCNQDQYETFIRQVPEFEHMLYEDGLVVVKFWFSISKDEQKSRFEARRKNPLKQWKLSPVDNRAQDLWNEYTRYKEEMFARTHTSFSPWVIVRANSKKKARLAAIRHILSLFPYEGKSDADVTLTPDPNIVARFHRRIKKID